MEYVEFLEVVSRLEYYSSLENTELSEYWTGLCNLCSSTFFAATPEFREAYMKEVIAQVEYIEENFKVVKKTRKTETSYEVLEDKFYEYGN